MRAVWLTARRITAYRSAYPIRLSVSTYCMLSILPLVRLSVKGQTEKKSYFFFVSLDAQ